MSPCPQVTFHSKMSQCLISRAGGEALSSSSDVQTHVLDRRQELRLDNHCSVVAGAAPLTEPSCCSSQLNSQPPAQPLAQPLDLRLPIVLTRLHQPSAASTSHHNLHHLQVLHKHLHPAVPGPYSGEDEASHGEVTVTSQSPGY